MHQAGTNGQSIVAHCVDLKFWAYKIVTQPFDHDLNIQKYFAPILVRSRIF